MGTLFNRVAPKVGQVTKQGGDRYEAINVDAGVLKAGDPIELVSNVEGRIGVKKWAGTNPCIGYVVSEVIDHEIKQGMALTYASTSTFIALNAAVALPTVGAAVKAHANGVQPATLPADAALVIGKVYGPAVLNGIAEIKLSVE